MIPERGRVIKVAIVENHFHYVNRSNSKEARDTESPMYNSPSLGYSRISLQHTSHASVTVAKWSSPHAIAISALFPEGTRK